MFQLKRTSNQLAAWPRCRFDPGEGRLVRLIERIAKGVFVSGRKKAMFKGLPRWITGQLKGKKGEDHAHATLNKQQYLKAIVTIQL